MSAEMWRTTTRNSPSAILSLPQGQPRAGGCGALNGGNPLPLILSLSKDAPLGEWRSTGKARSTSPTGATDQVQKISPQGEFLLKWGEPGNGPGQFNRPAGIAVDGDGDVYVADWHNHRVQVFSPHGEFLAELAGTPPCPPGESSYWPPTPSCRSSGGWPRTWARRGGSCCLAGCNGRSEPGVRHGLGEEPGADLPEGTTIA